MTTAGYAANSLSEHITNNVVRRKKYGPDFVMVLEEFVPPCRKEKVR